MNDEPNVPTIMTLLDYEWLYADVTGNPIPRTPTGRITTKQLRDGLADLTAFMPPGAPILETALQPDFRREPFRQSRWSDGSETRIYQREHLLVAGAGEAVFSDGALMLFGEAALEAIQDYREERIRKAAWKRNRGSLSKDEAREAERERLNEVAAIAFPGYDHVLSEKAGKAVRLEGHFTVGEPGEHVRHEDKLFACFSYRRYGRKLVYADADALAFIRSYAGDAEVRAMERPYGDGTLRQIQFMWKGRAVAILMPMRRKIGYDRYIPKPPR